MWYSQLCSFDSAGKAELTVTEMTAAIPRGPPSQKEIRLSTNHITLARVPEILVGRTYSVRRYEPRSNLKKQSGHYQAQQQCCLVGYPSCSRPTGLPWAQRLECLSPRKHRDGSRPNLPELGSLRQSPAYCHCLAGMPSQWDLRGAVKVGPTEWASLAPCDMAPMSRGTRGLMSHAELEKMTQKHILWF